MTDDRVARDRFGHERGAVERKRLQQALDAAVLIAEHDLQEEHVLAVRLEAKVSGLDDPRVHGSHGDLVNLRRRDAGEWIGLTGVGRGA